MTHDDGMLVGPRPTRRTLTRAAAWTVPVVAVAATAPAYAASPCDPRTGQVLDWDGAKVAFTRKSATAATAVYDPDGTGPVPGLTLDVTASYTGNMKAGSENGSTSQTMARQSTVGGMWGVSGLGLMQATSSEKPQGGKKEPVGYGDRGTYTFVFSKPVSNLVFTITDIDSTKNDFRDALIISGGYTVEAQAGEVEVKTEKDFIPSSWFQAKDDDEAVNDTSGSDGNITLKFAGPISTFEITYWNRQKEYDEDLDTDQRIFVSDMTFDYSPC